MSRREEILAQGPLPLAEIRRRLEAEALPRNVGALLDDASQAVSDRTALHFIDTGEKLTYRELRVAVNRLANGLMSAGVRKGTPRISGPITLRIPS